jgi:hypothetical protein
LWMIRSPSGDRWTSTTDPVVERLATNKESKYIK